jgi:hypothetical protein
MAQLVEVPFRCRFEMPSADGKFTGSQGDFCAFEFPGCRGCIFELHAIKTLSASEDPMKSLAWRRETDQPLLGTVSHAIFRSREEASALFEGHG